jgi:hypothetical protein
VLYQERAGAGRPWRVKHALAPLGEVLAALDDTPGEEMAEAG